MRDLLVAIEPSTGVLITWSDIITGVLSGIVLILLGRTAVAVKFAAAAGAIMFSNLRMEQRRKNAIEILRGARDQTTKAQLTYEKDNSILGKDDYSGECHDRFIYIHLRLLDTRLIMKRFCWVK
jgi:hypothetical protein